MGRGLLSLGSFLLVATVALWIAGAAEWIPEGLDDQVAGLTLRAGLVSWRRPWSCASSRR
jgi:hypothetical protein